MTVFQLLGRICGRENMGLPARSCTARLFRRSNAAWGCYRTYGCTKVRYAFPPAPSVVRTKRLNLRAVADPSIFRAVTPSRLSTNREARARVLVARERQALDARNALWRRGVARAFPPVPLPFIQNEIFECGPWRRGCHDRRGRGNPTSGSPARKRKVDGEMLGTRTGGEEKGSRGPDPSPVRGPSQCSCLLAPRPEPDS